MIQRLVLNLEKHFSSLLSGCLTGRRMDLPVTAEWNRLVTAGVTLVAVCSGAVGLAYVLATPKIAPSVAFIAHSPLLTVGFVLITVATAVNILTDSVLHRVRKIRL